MPQVIAGTASDLLTPNEKVVLDIIEQNYPTSGFSIPKTDVNFSLMGYDGQKDYAISTEYLITNIEPISLGRNRLERYLVDVGVHIWVRRAVEERPPEIYDLMRKVEEIMNERRNSMPFGITALLVKSAFTAIEFISTPTFGGSLLPEQQQSIWHTQTTVQLLYHKHITSV